MALIPTSSFMYQGVQCWECAPPGNVEEYNRNKPSRAERLIICDWNDSAILVNAILSALATAGSTPIGGSGVSGWLAPFAYPRAPWLLAVGMGTKMYAGALDPISGYPGGLKDLTYTWGSSTDHTVGGKYAGLTITYASQDYLANNIGNLSMDFSEEVVTVPQAQPMFSWASGAPTTPDVNDVPVTDSPPLRNTLIGFGCTRNNMAGLPMNTILTAMAAPVNSTTFAYIGNSFAAAGFSGFPAGSVKFEGLRSIWRVVAGGTALWDATFQMTYRSYDWNSFYRPLYTTPQAIYRKGSSIGYYLTSDLNLLMTGLS